MIELAGKGFLTPFQHSNNERGLYEVIGRRFSESVPTTIQTHQTFHEILGRALIDNLVYLFYQLVILFSKLCLLNYFSVALLLDDCISGFKIIFVHPLSRSLKCL